jgi:hypothetical protein
MKKRLMMLLVVAAMSVAVLAIPAAAGEVSGPPGAEGAEGASTPIDGFWDGDGAGSICSFSGLNDVIDDEEPTQTQSYGTFVSHIMLAYEVSVQEAKAILGDSPGNECNPNRAPWGNPRTG